VNGVTAVVGGSGGLGEAICLDLAAEGRSLLVGYFRGEEKAAELVSRIEASGGSASCLAVDVRDSTSVEDFLSTANAMEGGLQSVVNAVGPPIPLRPLADITADEFGEIMRTDVNGAFNLLTASARRLATRSGGAIVQLLTTAVLRTLENDGMSGIPKTAIMGIVRQLAREMGSANVRINAVAPGVIDAGIVHSSFTLDDTAKGVIDLCLQRTPMPRLGQPCEVAALVRYLLGDGAGYVSGQVIGVDGGYSA
jgi:3-oxoacyl-[acyl-carrier protein] reductase